MFGACAPGNFQKELSYVDQIKSFDDKYISNIQFAICRIYFIWALLQLPVLSEPVTVCATGHCFAAGRPSKWCRVWLIRALAIYFKQGKFICVDYDGEKWIYFANKWMAYPKRCRSLQGETCWTYATYSSFMLTMLSWRMKIIHRKLWPASKIKALNVWL